MILDAARLSFANLFAPETRSVFWKVLGLTLLALVRAVVCAARAVHLSRFAMAGRASAGNA